MMVVIQGVVGALLACLLGMGAGMVAAQDFPNKQIRIITGGAGGGSDFNARQAAIAIGALGQTVVVDNRPSLLVGEVGAKNAPDGYNLTVHGASLWLVTFLQKMPYDVARDFAPISLMSREVMVLAVHPSLPVKSVKELLALAKSRPGDLTYATSTPGGPAMLGMELLKAMSKINMLSVPYKDTRAAITAVFAGESQLTIGDLGLVVPLAKQGRLRTLAVTSLDPTALAPGMPTMAESGLPGFEVTGVTAIWAPAKTPPAVLNRLSTEVVRHLNRPDVKEKFLGAEMEVVASGPDGLQARLKSDINKWVKVFTDAGIKPQ
jgi:tripartite-type tricarboxylate transporter receptor subunit TctC